MKSNPNIENDIALRKGISAVYKTNKTKDTIKKSMKDEKVKQGLMDFIFGKTEESPIKRDSNGDLVSVSSREICKETYSQDCELQVETGTKICKCCGKEKDASEFYIRRKSKDYLQVDCKDCQTKRLSESKK